MWSEVQEAELSASWVELPESGWGALMGRAAGRENLRRHPSSDADKVVTGYTEHAGVRHDFEGPFTATDRQGVDDDIDSYLRDADVPPRPRGYVWLIRVPVGHASPEGFLDDVESSILRAAGAVTHPKRLRPIFAAVLRGFYAQGPRFRSGHRARAGDHADHFPGA
ncbi:DUF5956 family protein [Arthrobacter sp. NPDC056886]|uniref:DUF5956 family protein n=1 Tax=Arthrobacter sp. NPDC056886 TaxID=3345960 RepID=UPI00367016E9